MIFYSMHEGNTASRESKIKAGIHAEKMKTLNFVEKLLLSAILLICALLLFLFWYKQTVSVEVTDIHKVNSSSLVRKLLIAAPSSPFKDSITVGIVDRYHSSQLVVEVVDIRDLATIDAADFDAILIMHIWEAGAPAEIEQSFIAKNLELENKIVILTTSWNGLEKMENIDAITGASVVDDVPVFTAKIIKRLDRLLKYKK